MSRTLAVLAALGLAIGAAGETEACAIYTFTTDTADLGPAVSGSFQVDSSHIGARATPTSRTSSPILTSPSTD